MFDLFVIAIGVYFTKKAHDIYYEDRRKSVLLFLGVITIGVYYMFPQEMNRVLPKYETLPKESVLIESDVEVSKWKEYGLTSTYTNVREFLMEEEQPVLVYNPREMSADEARRRWKESEEEWEGREM